MNPELIDSHCHLDHTEDTRPADDLIREAEATGISFLINVCTVMKEIPQLEATSLRHANVFHTIGVHPHDAAGLPESDVPALEKAARHPKCRAVGETGLDY